METFIEGCYDYTRGMSGEWKWYIDNFARWVDFDNSYKTMDNNYMESVWWVFKSIWDKGLIYKGKRVSFYSTKLETPISNFEVAMDDSYSEVNDPAITVKFPIKTREASIAWVVDEQERFLMGWSKKYNGRHLVGGSIHDGENPEQAVIRELQEEVMVTATADDLVAIT